MIFPDILIIHHVLYIPSFHFNLVSVSKILDQQKHQVIFAKDKCFLQELRNMKMTGLGDHEGGLYKLRVPYIDVHVNALNSTDALESDKHVTSSFNNDAIWHYRLGHVSAKGLKSLHVKFPFISPYVDDCCNICHLAKQRHLPYSVSSNIAQSAFDLLHLDIWGPYSVNTIHGHKYFLTIVDDFSRFTWVCLMRSKSETQQHITNFVLMVDVATRFIPFLIT